MGDLSPRHRVLLVYDDPVILDALSYGLRKAHYSVERCADAAAALAAYRQSPPDLAIVDIGLPDMGGTALAEALLCHRYRPILILSSYSEREWVDRAIVSGVFGYLVKPLTVEQLIPSIETALARFSEVNERIALKFGDAKMSEKQLASAMDQFSFGIIIVDKDHHIIHSNRLGQEYLSAGCAIISRNGRLGARIRGRQFDAMLDRSLGVGCRSAPCMVSLHNAETDATIQAWSTPLPGSENAVSSAIVIVNDPVLTTIAPQSLLKALFGLTKKESALAHALVNGVTINDYCNRTFITRNTARTHLRSIYRKTSTHRQVDLIRLLSRLFINSPGD